MYFPSGKQTISRVENMGETITLSDRSVWKVGMFDKYKTMMWMMLDEVTVQSYIGKKFKMTNTKRKETIEAEFITKA